MMRRTISTRLAVTASALAGAALILAGSAGAQQAPAKMPAATAAATKAPAAARKGPPVKEWKTPADLNRLVPVDTSYTPPRTQWGDYDFAHTWQIENLNAARILFQRPKVWGDRVYVNSEEFGRRLAAAQHSDSSFSNEGQGLNAGGTQGLANWVTKTEFGHRTSMLIDPADGQLPALTPWAEELWKNGRSSWVPGQSYDSAADFDSWDRCVSRGFPASMFPFRYNNGIRIFQSPGYMVINLEMLGTRVIPIGNAPKWPGAVEAWMGDGRGHWEGKTFVIETSNIKSGDGVTYDIQKRAASPLNMATQNVPPFNTIPTSVQAHTVERLTMVDANTMDYQITYDDPQVFTKPWTARFEWARDDSYQFFEYACIEGDVQVANYIKASRAERAAIAAGTKKPEVGAADSRNTFAKQFDYDPAANDRPAFPGRGGPRGAAPPPPAAKKGG
jgi:hypothetical protein